MSSNNCNLDGSCAHTWSRMYTDDNSDRTRTEDFCAKCGWTRYGVLAKRLDDQGRVAWGPVGRWLHSFEVKP